MQIDLNADLGEGFGPWSMGDDAPDADAGHLGQYRLRGSCGRSRDDVPDVDAGQDKTG